MVRPGELGLGIGGCFSIGSFLGFFPQPSWSPLLINIIPGLND